MKLTVKEIAAYAPPQGKDRIVFDQDLPGFGLRYRNGHRTWVFQYAHGSGASRVNGRITIGEYPALPPAKALPYARYSAPDREPANMSLAPATAASRAGVSVSPGLMLK
jgi:hypothetical protein